MVLVVLLAMTVGAAHVSAHSLCPRPGDIGSLAVAAQMIGGRIKPGRLFMYTYDGIGNRQWAVMGTPGGGSSQTKTAYTTNSKNQLTQAVNPGVAHVSGYAPADSRVEITYDTDTFAAVREGTYWYAAVPVDNSAAAVCASIHVTVIDEAGSVSHQETITRLVPKAVETISYDPRGNQTEDSIWEYTWDAMDRLTAVEMKEVTGADRVKVEFQYDFFGRRATKEVYSYNDGWVPEYTRKFIWAGWLLQAETNGDDELIRSYVWGRDVSGGVGGAAGIGGLLAVRTHNPATGAVTATYWVASDEHGNVTGLVKAAAGTGGRETVAAFEYGPYGQLLAVDAGAGAGVTNNTPTALCPFLYSSKYYDEEIGLYYYGYRYYDPRTGRWLNRDPLAERGGFNLYQFCFGEPIGWLDPLGWAGWREWARTIIRSGVCPIGGALELGLGCSDAQWARTGKAHIGAFQDAAAGRVYDSTVGMAENYVRTAVSEAKDKPYLLACPVALGMRTQQKAFAEPLAGSLVGAGSKVKDAYDKDGLVGAYLQMRREEARLTPVVSGVVDAGEQWAKDGHWSIEATEHLGEAGGDAALLVGTYAASELLEMALAPKTLARKPTLDQRINARAGSKPQSLSVREAGTGSRSLPEAKRLRAPQRLTPPENAKARNLFKRNKYAAKRAWEEREGKEWPTDEYGQDWPAEHTPALKEGGDPMHVTPRDPGLPDPHNIPGPDGLTDYQRWGAEGTPARQAKRNGGV